MRCGISVLAALGMLAAAPAMADPPIGANTPCQQVVDYLNAKDSPHAREALLAVKQLMASYDQEAITHGKPSALAPLSARQAEDIYIAAIEYCRDDPHHTLGQAASDAYEGLTELHGQLPAHR